MSDKTSPSRQLAAFAAEANVPTSMLDAIEGFLLDFAGHTAWSSRFAESSPAFRRGVRQLDAAGSGCTVVGDDDSYSPLQAAMLNGAFAHTMDFDDTNVLGALHPGAPVIPAALAAAEQGNARGLALLESVSVGYEVACRVGAALGETAYDRGFHITGVAGIFGAVAAVGRLQGLGADTIGSAFGIAGSLASGSMQYLENGSWNKRLHPGFAAHNALIALSFARAGVLTAEEPIAGRFGLLKGYSAAPKPDALTADLGGSWLAEQTGIKPYPSCRLTHGAVDAALLLREGMGAGLADARLHIELGPKAFDIVGEPLPGKVAPRNIVDAQFSVYFQTAVAWLDGRADWQSYGQLGSPAVEALSRRMKVSVDPQLKGPGARVSVEGLPGATVCVPVPSGEPSTPLGRDRIRAKYLSLAVPVFGEARATEIAKRLLGLRSEASAAEVIRRLQSQSQSQSIR